MAEVDFSDPKPGFKRWTHDSPWCTACEAKNHQWCNHNDIIPHISMGTGWKNVGEKGCEVGKCKAICGKDFKQVATHSCCLGLNPDPLQTCHPDWKNVNSADCKPFITEQIIYMLTNSKLPSDMQPGVRSWLDSGQNSGEYENLKKSTCSATGGTAAPGSICDIWCNQHPGSCHLSRVQFCNVGDNVASGKCQNWKDVSLSSNSDSTQYFNAEERYCSQSADRMRSPGCTRWATDPRTVRLSRATKVRYDDWWHKFCDQVHFRASGKPSTFTPRDQVDLDLALHQCSCTLPPGVKPDDKTTILSYPYCFNPVCMTRPEAYKTLQGFDDTRQCPNVCANIIQNNAGGTGIIRNVNIIQNCFNAQGQSNVSNVIREQIQKELKPNIEKMIQTYIITGNEYETFFREFLEKNPVDLKPYRDAMGDLGTVEKGIPSYTDIQSYIPYRSLKAVQLELKDSIPDIRNAYTKVISMEWPRTEDAQKLAEQYQQLCTIFGESLQGYTTTLREFIGNVDLIKKRYDELVAERTRLRTQVTAGEEAAKSGFERIQARISGLSPEIQGQTAGDLEVIRGLIRGLDKSFLEHVNSNVTLRIQVKKFEDSLEVVQEAIGNLDRKVENLMGGQLRDRASRIKNALDKEEVLLQTKFGRVADLGRAGKLSDLDKEQFHELSAEKRAIDEEILRFNNIYSSPELTPEVVQDLLNLKEEIFLSINTLIPKLDAIKEFVRETPDEEERRRQQEEEERRRSAPGPGPGPAPKDHSWIYWLAGIVGIFIIIFVIYMKK